MVQLHLGRKFDLNDISPQKKILFNNSLGKNDNISKGLISFKLKRITYNILK